MPTSPGKPFKLLVVDDDPDDCLLIKEALDEAHCANSIEFMRDGVELMDYLRDCGVVEHLAYEDLPDLILLDLNMPRKDGRETLVEIKTDPRLRHIPVVILTTSKAEEDVLQTYDLGANSYIVKPVKFEGLVETMKSVTDYWVQAVRLLNRTGFGGGSNS